jgi:hypothetical protein
MKRVLVILALVAAQGAAAQDGAGGAATEASAPVAVPITDQRLDPAFVEQMRLLAERPEVLRERDVIVLTDTDPAARSAIRDKLRPHGFDLVLIDKDGRVAFRKPVPWDLRELSRAIDKTPLRIQELRDQRPATQ